MLASIIEDGFSGIAAILCLFAFISLVFYILAAMINAAANAARFDLKQIFRMFLTNLIFMTIFALLGYFLV